MVAEAFVKSGLDLFYYQNKSSMLEGDFFLRTKKDIVAIEVKAKDGNSKSLKRFLATEAYDEVRVGIKLVDKNIGYNNTF